MTQASGDVLLLGAVAYAPKVVTIWEGFRDYFVKQGLPFDFVLYSNYERQVESHFLGHIHVAWNSPLAWLQSQRLAREVNRRAEAICMRDTDRDLTSLIVVRSDSSIHSLEDLRGKRIGVGAKDSPQATLIPLLHIERRALVRGKDFEVVFHDLLAGKHGDHVGGEREAARSLLRGDVDAACMIDGNHLTFVKEGTLPSGATRILAQTPDYDHCNFTVLDGAPRERVERFRELLVGMSYEDPQVRLLLDLEGLRQWQPGRTEKYAQLEEAVDRSGYLDPFLQELGSRCR